MIFGRTKKIFDRKKHYFCSNKQDFGRKKLWGKIDFVEDLYLIVVWIRAKCGDVCMKSTLNMLFGSIIRNTKKIWSATNEKMYTSSDDILQLNPLHLGWNFQMSPKNSPLILSVNFQCRF